jgi:hypothetical protein
VRFGAAVWRLIRAPFSTRSWRILLLHGVGIDALLQGQADFSLAIELGPPTNWRYFWADPCVVMDGCDEEWVYVEEFDRLRGLGHIRALHVSGGRVVRSAIVLAGRHHRAFPRVWREANEWRATVDGCEYPAQVFSFRCHGSAWSPVAGSDLPSTLIDPNLIHDGPDCVVVGTSWLRDEARDLEVWRRNANLGGEWRLASEESYSHDLYARGAGNVDVVRGIRAVQDCSTVYGLSVSLIEWPVHGGKVVPVQQVSGSTLGFTGTHTLAWNSDGAVVVLDAWDRRPDALGWLWKLTDLRHLKRCRRRTRRQLQSRSSA